MAPKQKHILKPPFQRRYVDMTRYDVHTLPTRVSCSIDGHTAFPFNMERCAPRVLASAHECLAGEISNRGDTMSFADQFIMMKFDLQ